MDVDENMGRDVVVHIDYVFVIDVVVDIGGGHVDM